MRKEDDRWRFKMEEDYVNNPADGSRGKGVRRKREYIDI
jgi:hypothetical protein